MPDEYGNPTVDDIPDLSLTGGLLGDGTGLDAFNLGDLGGLLGQLGAGGSAGGGYMPADFQVGVNNYGGSTGIVPISPVTPGRVGILRAVLPRGTTARGFLTAIKQLGLDAVARALGRAPELVARAYIAAKGKPRRSRGISGRQLRMTGQVLRKLGSMNRRVSAYVTAGGFTRHRSASPARHPFARKRK